MSANEKDPNLDDLCKNHVARGNKHLYRTCPSKLSRHELEDLYYKFLENNLELKQTVNSETHKNRLLTTKLQRLTTLNRAHAKEPRNCCEAAKAVIAEQRTSIKDLERENELMAERIRRLNTRLCTAKQFLKKSSSQISKYNGFAGASTSVKNLSTSALVNKDFTANLISTVVSLQPTSRDSFKMKSVKTNTEEEIHNDKLDVEKVCDENKCRSAVEEFKQRITDLQDELSKSHEEYSGRISQLEQRVCHLQEASSQQQRLLRDAQAQRVELEMQLSMEKQKVAELEMRLISANMSQEVANTIAEHLAVTSQLKIKRTRNNDKLCNVCNSCVTPCPPTRSLSPVKAANVPGKPDGLTAPDDKPYRSDDSGYADHRDSDQGGIIYNQDLANRIAHLQAQLNAIKMSGAERGQPFQNVRRISADSYDVVIDKNDVPVLENVKDYSCVVIDPSKKVILEIDHVNEGSEPEKSVDRKNKHDEETQDQEHINFFEDQDSHQRRCDKVEPESATCSRHLPELNVNSYQKNETLKGINISENTNTTHLIEDLEGTRGSIVDNNEKVNTTPQKEDLEETRGSLLSRDMSHMYKKRDSLNDETKPLRNGSSIGKNQTDMINLDSVLPSKPLDTNVSKNRNVICECPNCDDDLAAKTAIPASVLTSKQLETNVSKNRNVICECQKCDDDLIVKAAIPESVLPSKQLETNVSKNRNVICECPKCYDDLVEKTTVLASVLPSKQLETNVSNKINVIRECPCDNDLAKKTAVSGSAKTKNDSLELYKNKVRRSTPHEVKTFQEDESKKDGKTSQDTLKLKLDGHNSLQIPGPLPVNLRDSNTSKIYSTRTRNKPLQERKVKKVNGRKGAGINIYEDKVLECRKPGVMVEEKLKVYTEKDAHLEDLGMIMPKKLMNGDIQTLKGSINKDIDKRNSRERCPNEGDRVENDTQKSIQNMESIDDRPLRDGQNETETKSVKEHVKCLNERIHCCRDQGTDKVEARIEICSRRAPICTCPQTVRRSLAICRTCSGTRTFLTKPDGVVLKRCNCAYKAGFLECGNKLQDTNEPLADCRSPLKNSECTYTVPGTQEVNKCSRPTSPENTDHEISFLSDLPTENGTCSRVLSPGEHKPATTSTTTHGDSFSPYKDLSLSEGELPNEKYPRKGLSISLGEQPHDKRIDPRHPESSDDRMEAALQAISQELARCRMLLQSQWSPGQRPDSRDAETITEQPSRESGRDSITLRKVEGKSRISRTIAPKCMFTLHIGTIVLSDEAVINSRAAPLMLTWKFFDQHVAMTRITAGRVVHFDFSTEYEIKITEEFINYLKHEEMPIRICEIDDKETPFATCALPLREALLNANRRVDLSLALVARPHMARSTDSLDASDEIGVLDLWCMLRAETRTMASINRAIAVSTTNVGATPPPDKLGQIIDEDQSYDYRLSQDLDMHMSSLSKQNLERLMPVKPMNTALGARSNILHQHGELKAPSLTSNLAMTSAEKSSEIILTEVTPKVRMSNEIKHYLENTDDSNLKYVDQKNESWRKKSTNSIDGFKKVTIPSQHRDRAESSDNSRRASEVQKLDITVLWLALNEECRAMRSPAVRRLYVAYSFLARDGAELETPLSLPKPKHYIDKCFFNFKKTFYLTEFDLPILKHMAQCRSHSRNIHSLKDCIVFSVVSEPPEDPLGLDNCEDIGYGFLYLGDLLAYCPGDTFTEVLPVRSAHAEDGVCGVLAVKLDGLDVVRACALGKSSR